MCPYFEVRRKKTMRSGSLRRSAHSRGTVIDKPWFTPELKNKFTTYRIALSTFNRTKNKKNHQLLLVAKKSYKCMESRLKRGYLRREGDMLEHMRKSNPKVFYKYFKKKQPKQTMITNDAFFEHFKVLANSKEVIQKIGPNVENTAFEELDEEITENEIRHAIKHLKRGKSHGLDNIINEYFIEFSDSLIPLLNTLFNKIFSSGIFPKAWSNCVIVPILKWRRI